MLLSPPKRSAQCSKPGCVSRYTSRHHMGSEKMWLRYFADRALSRRYRAHRKRYYEFDPSDVVELCKDHHEEIHQIYSGIIEVFIQNNKKPLWKWSWKQAEELMEALRAECKKWLLVETEGTKNYIYLRG